MVTPLVLDYQIEKACDAWLYPAKKRLQRWLNTALEVLAIEEALEVTIRLVSDEEITELNKKYRHQAGATNVLSFPCAWGVPEKPRLLGDIVIAIAVVNEEAKRQKKKMEDHWAHIAIHGFLHLLGYDHCEAEEAEIMENLEGRILAELGFANKK